MGKVESESPARPQAQNPNNRKEAEEGENQQKFHLLPTMRRVERGEINGTNSEQSLTGVMQQ